jgi:hypothetical protein
MLHVAGGVYVATLRMKFQVVKPCVDRETRNLAMVSSTHDAAAILPRACKSTELAFYTVSKSTAFQEVHTVMHCGSK